MASHSVSEMQARLVDLGYLKEKRPDGKSNIDNRFGETTLDAYNHYRATLGKGAVVKADEAEVERDLWPDEQPPPAPKPTFTIPGISEIGNIISIFNQVKELQMNTANVAVITSWLSSKNWAAAIAILTSIAAFFHIVIPPDLGPTVLEVVTAVTGLYVLIKNTWFTTSVTAASAKKLS